MPAPVARLRLPAISLIVATLASLLGTSTALAAAPATPTVDVVSSNGEGTTSSGTVYQASSNGTVWFKQGVASNIALTATDSTASLTSMVFETTDLLGDLTWSPANTSPVIDDATTSAETTAVTSHTVSLPSSIQADDLLIILWTDSNTASTLTPPSGWTQIYAATNGSRRGNAYYKVATGSEGASVTFTTSVAETSAHNAMRLSGYAGTPETTTAATGSDTNPDPPSLTTSWTTAAGSTRWIATAHTAGTVSASAPTNYSGSQFATSGGTGGSRASMANARRARVIATEDPGTFTLDGSRAWIANTIAVEAGTYRDTTSPYEFLVSTTTSTAGSHTLDVWATKISLSPQISSHRTITLTADGAAPTVTYSVPASGTAIQSSTTINATWTEADTSGSGVDASTRSVQRQKASASSGACPSAGDGSWTNDGSATTTASPRNDSSLTSGNCYRYKITLGDHVGNSATTTSGKVLIDSSAPSAPSVTASGTNVYQAAANGTIFFKSGGSGTLAMAATTSDAQSGIASVTWNAISPTTGWTPTGGTDASDPYQVSMAWSSSAASGTQTVAATNGAGTASSNTSLTMTADATGPTVTIGAPASGTTSQSTTSVSATWSESDGGSGLDTSTRSVQRQIAAASGGSCPSAGSGSWTNDGSATTGASPRNDSSLSTGNCYRWKVTLSDHVGNSTTSTSGNVIVDTGAPTAPSVTASGTGVYQNAPNGPIYFRGGTSGTLGMTATSTDTGSGIGSITWNAISPSTAWTPTGGSDNTSPFQQNLAWTSSTGSGTQTVVATNGASTQSSSTSLSITVDGTAPAISSLVPAAGTSSQYETAVTVSWSETETGSGIGSRSLQRQKASGSGAGDCASATYTNDGSAQDVASPQTQSGLTINTCYRWQLGLTDNVGNGSGTSTSGLVFVAELPPPPSAPSVPDLDTASDTGPLSPATSTYTLRPVSDELTVGSPTIVPSGAAYAAVDESPINYADYVQPHNYELVIMGFDPSAIPATDTIVSVTVNGQVWNGPPAAVGYLSVRNGTSGELWDVDGIGQDGADSQSATYTFMEQPWDGQPWTLAGLEDFQPGAHCYDFCHMALQQLWLSVETTGRTPTAYDSDDVTSDTTPTLTGTNDTGATSVELYEGTTLLGSTNDVSGGTWSITSSQLSDGVHTLKVKAVGPGGSSSAGPTLDVTIASTGPDVDLADASDTGPVVVTEPVATVRPSSDTVKTGSYALSSGTTAWNLVDESLLINGIDDYLAPGSGGTVVVGLQDPDLPSGARVISVTIYATVRNNAPSAAGSIVLRDPDSGDTFEVIAVGQNPSADQSVTLTERPWDGEPWTADDVAALQAGATCSCNLQLRQLWAQVTYLTTSSVDYNHDDVTNDSTPTLGGPNSPTAARVDLYQDDVLVASDEDVADGDWSITLDPLADGDYEFTAVAVDEDEVETTTLGAVTVTIDTDAPDSPSTPNMTAATDAGVSDTDNITDEKQPEFTGTTGSGVETVALLDDAAQVGDDIAISGGTYSATPVEPLLAGERSFSAVAYDLAGNASDASDGLDSEILDSLVVLKAYTTPTGDVGSVNWVSVVVQDDAGNPLDTFDGTITLTSSDPLATFPDGNTYDMTPGEDGTGHDFRVVFGTPGSQTVTAKSPGSQKGKTHAVVVSDITLELVVDDNVHFDIPFAVRVVPRKADGTVARQYASEITLTASGGDVDFGPEVDGSGHYQYDCGCGDGHTFGAIATDESALVSSGIAASSNGLHGSGAGSETPITIGVEDSYGHTNSAETTSSPAPTGGTDPLAEAWVVQWQHGTVADYYVQASAALTVVAVADYDASNDLVGLWLVNSGIPTGYGQFSAPSATTDFADLGHHTLLYVDNATGTAFETAPIRSSRFDGMTDAANYQQIDAGDPILSWSLVERTNETTTLHFTAFEPFWITGVRYAFSGLFNWQPGPGEYPVPAGESDITISNDPAICGAGSVYNGNDNLWFDYFPGGGRSRQAHRFSPISGSDPGYSGACSSDPPGGPDLSPWLTAASDPNGDMAEQGQVSEGDPIDVQDGYLHADVTDIDLGGLQPALRFTRSYDGHVAEASNADGPPDTLLGPGWTTSLDWRLSFRTDPDGIQVLGGDGGTIEFLDNGDGSYSSFAGAPFTLETITGGFELHRLDRTGYRFDDAGRLDAVLGATGQTMSVSYDGGGHISSATDASGRTMTFTTNGAGHVTAITLPDERSVSYSYDNGVLASAMDLAGTEVHYVTDFRSRITRITNGAGATLLKNVYDGAGRVVQQVDAEGISRYMTYDPMRTTTQGVNPLNATATYCYDPTGHVTTAYDAMGGARQIDYDSFGHARSVTDQLGNTSRLTTDQLGRLLATRDAMGRESTFTYNEDGTLDTIGDAQGRTIETSYDAGLPDAVTVSDGVHALDVASFTYTADGQVETSTAPGGAITTLAYDASGYLESLLDPTDGETTFTTDDRGYVTRIVDPLGNKSGGVPNDHDAHFTYDDMGRQTSSEDATGVQSSQTYDDFGRVLTSTDPAGTVTTYAYDNNGRLLSSSTAIPDEDPAVTTYEYDDAGNQTAVVDAEGRRTEYTYDTLGRVTAMQDADGQVWLTSYDLKGRVASQTDPTDRTTHYHYDAGDRLTSVVDNDDNETTYTYDAADRLLTVTDPDDHTTTYTYDWLGRRTSVTDANDETTTFEYDDANDLVSFTDANEHTTTYAYDDAHRLLSVVDAADGETTYAYDEAGRQTSRTDANEHATTFGYDAASRQTSITDALSHAWQTVYDAAGRVDHTIDANDQQTDFAYDDLGRLETISPDTGSDITYAYDLTGRRTSMTDGAGTTTYDYDGVGHLTSSTRASRTVGYAYDHAGRLKRVDYPASLGSVHLDYDVAGRLSTITDWASRVTSLAYDPTGNLTELDRPGDLVTTYGYDDVNRVTSISHAYDSSSVLDLAYTYDPVGNVLTRTDDSGTASFDYDELDRLTSAAYPGSNAFAYTYDPVGNLTQIDGPSGTINHTYDDADRISDSGYSFDDNGELLSDGVRTFAYDALGRLTSVSASGLSAAYTYDGDGNRVSQTVNSSTTGFDLNLSGSLSTVLVAGSQAYLPGMPELGSLTSGSWKSSLTDAQGSVLAAIDGSGTVTGLTHLDPYGNPLPGDSATAGIGYTGAWADASRLVNLRARLYDPTLARFLSRDTFLGVDSAPASQNPYAYTQGNPLRYVDPSGHWVQGALNAGGNLLNFAWETGSGVVQGGVNIFLGSVQTVDAALDLWACSTDPWCMAQLSQQVRDAIQSYRFDPAGNLAAGLDGIGDFGVALQNACNGGDRAACARVVTEIVGPILLLRVGGRSGTVEGPGTSVGANVPKLAIDDAQFGAKVAQHARDWGLDPSSAFDRSLFRTIVDDIARTPDEVRQGPWNPAGGGGTDYLFYRKGADVVVARGDGSFVTILRNGTSNPWFLGATPR